MSLLDYLSVQNVLLSTIVLLLLYLGYMSRFFWTFRRMGVKGPSPIPVFGNLMSIFSKGIVNVDKELFAKYKEIGYCGTFEGEQPVLLIYDLDAIREITIKQFGNFTNHRSFEALESFPNSHFLTVMKDDHWKHVRNNLTPAFSTGKLRRMIPLIRDCCEELLEGFQKAADAGTDTDIKKLVGGFTMDVIGRTAFGLETDTQKNPDNLFVESARAFFNVGSAIFVIFFLPFLSPLFKLMKYQAVPRKYIDFFSNVTMAALKERQQDTSGKYRDFMQLMAEAEVNSDVEIDKDIDHRDALTTSSKWTNKGLTTEDILGTGILFLVAGYETTATTICFTLHLLATNPECQTRAQEEVDQVLKGKKPNQDTVLQLNYLEMCLMESLRLYPPASRTDRVCSEETVIKGLTIPRGLVVGIPIGTIHRDPELWPDPEKFDPERFTPEQKAQRHPMSFLAFGQGPRNCIGMRLALIEAKMALASILQKFTLVPGEKTEIPLKLKKLGLSSPVNGFWLKVKKRE